MVETSPHGGGGVLDHINPAYDPDEDGLVDNKKIEATGNFDSGDQFSGYPLNVGVDTNGPSYNQETGSFAASANTLATQQITLSQAYDTGILQSWFANDSLSPLSDADTALSSYDLANSNVTVVYHNATGTNETVEWRFIGRF